MSILIQKKKRGQNAYYKTDSKAVFHNGERLSVILDNSQQKEKVLDINSSDCILVTGSSLTEGALSVNGYGWVEKLNDIVDIPMINQGVGARSLLQNISVLQNNDTLNMASSVRPKDINITHIMWDNVANTTATTNNKADAVVGVAQMNLAKKICEKYGAEMLITPEEPWHVGVQNIWVSFARMNNIKWMNGNDIINKCYPASYYKGLIYLGHRNWRAIAPYSCYRDFVDKINIKQAIKLYKVRPKFTVSHVNSLAYDNNEQRLYRFYGISAGVKPSSYPTYTKKDFTEADNLDNASYAITSASTINDYHTSDVAKFMNGESISFNNYALVEAVLNTKNVTSMNFEIECSVQPSNVYILKNASTLAVDSINSTFSQLTFAYSGGKIIASSDCVDIMHEDKVAILIQCNGDFTVAKPIIKYIGEDKLADKNFTQRVNGEEIMSKTNITSDIWTFSGTASIVTMPEGCQQHTGYNNSNDIAILKANGDSMTCTASHTKGTKIALRIVAQNFYKYMTNRFSGQSGYDDFATTEVALGEHEYDYGKLRVTVNDTIIREFIVQSGWSELYAELDTEEMGNLTVKIERINESGIYSSANTPIHIHDVSLQKY